MRTLALVSSLLLLAGCPKQEAASGTGAAVAEAAAADVPSDAASRAFAETLMKNPLESFSPDDGGGASFKWKSLGFGAGNVWKAASVLSAGGEDVDCEESGRWSLEKAEAPTKATVVLQTQATSCPGRSESKEYRLVMTRDGGGWQVSFR